MARALPARTAWYVDKNERWGVVGSVVLLLLFYDSNNNKYYYYGSALTAKGIRRSGILNSTHIYGGPSVFSASVTPLCIVRYALGASSLRTPPSQSSTTATI